MEPGCANHLAGGEIQEGIQQALQRYMNMKATIEATAADKNFHEMVLKEIYCDRATSACVSPASSRAKASCRWCGVSLRGRPNLTPRSWIASCRRQCRHGSIPARTRPARPGPSGGGAKQRPDLHPDGHPTSVLKCPVALATGHFGTWVKERASGLLVIPRRDPDPVRAYAEPPRKARFYVQMKEPPPCGDGPCLKE